MKITLLNLIESGKTLFTPKTYKSLFQKDRRTVHETQKIFLLKFTIAAIEQLMFFFICDGETTFHYLG